MKTRFGYVSNSSSSSYIVMPDDLETAAGDEEEAKQYIAGYAKENAWAGGKWDGLIKDGEMKFGWQTMDYNSAAAKWNWLVLQAFYGGQEEMETVDGWLEDIGAPDINWNAVEIMDDKCDAYIDHQSVCPKETFSMIAPVGVWAFLSSKNCFIHNGNDNGVEQ